MTKLVEEKATERVTTLLTPTKAEMLKRDCFETGISRSECLRQLVDMYLDRIDLIKEGFSYE